MKTGALAVFNIPAGVQFAENLAATLLQQTYSRPQELSEIRLILPTRRSCRIVRDSFLRQSSGAALILPRMQAAGDVDDAEIDFENAAVGGDEDSLLSIPPALSSLRRQIILSRLVMQRPDYTGTPSHALALAKALAELLDRVHTEGKDLRDLRHLVDEEFAEHWGITLKFLTIISEVWPEILAAEGCIDTADRRNRLLRSMADYWENTPPAGRIIAAGSTGSIPATARLLKIIAGLPQGQVILPGLDQDMDEWSWDRIDDTHPQATLKNLLHFMGITRSDVRLWDQEINLPRQILAREIMRPAATTDEWRGLGKKSASLQQGLEGLQQIDCSTAQEEARLISLIFRHVQHSSPKTAALVTFDRDLARRVAASCARWGIVIDDSAGQRLTVTPAGGFLALCAGACIEQLAPVALLALLKHHHAAAGMAAEDYRVVVRRLDRHFLRGPRPGPGIEGLAARAPEMKTFIRHLDIALSPFLALCNDDLHPFKALLRAHILVAEGMAASPGRCGADQLWVGEDGESAARFLSELQDYADGIPPVRAADYLSMLQTMMEGITVRPAWGTHPRLMILGPMESRLIQADVMILGGLNEGSWPPAASIDPWMSRPMRQKFDLPSPERSIGLSAHDFVQGFSAPIVILTRSARQGTAPTIPSRWLQRLDAVLKAARLTLPITDWAEKAQGLDHPPGPPVPIQRPAPRPPVEKRPVRLSVTEIETWMRDPYAIYARHILSLQKIDPVDQLPDASDRGTILHEALERFVSTYPDHLPDRADIELRKIGHALLDQQVDDVPTRHFWGVRFDKMVDWFILHERTWRTKARMAATEIKGVMTLPGSAFTLSGKADRFDVMRDGSGLAIIDYKTGFSPSNKLVTAGVSPQLPLEAAMVRAGSFPDILAIPIVYIGYWKLTGGKDGGERVVDGDVNQMADAAIEGLTGLVQAFADPQTPYLSQPRPSARPRYSDYTHLARVKEWSVLDEFAGEDT